MELLSPLFFLQLPPVFAPHSRLEPILQFTALHLGILHPKTGQVGIKGTKMIIESNRNESQESGVALELLSPLFFLQSPPIFALHLRLEPILQFTVLHLGILHPKMGQIGIKGAKMILESMKE